MKKTSKKSLGLLTANSTSNSKIKKYSPLSPVNKKKSKTVVSQSNLSNKGKNQNKKINDSIKKEPEDYIVVNGQFFSANTFTERNKYESFLTQVKRQKQIERKSFLVKSQISQLKKSRQSNRKHQFTKIQPQDLIKGLSLQQKKQIFYKLQRQIHHNEEPKARILSQPLSNAEQFLRKKAINNQQEVQLDNLSERSQRVKENSQRFRAQKFAILQTKLQHLKMQLMFKYQGQVDKLELLKSQGKLSQMQVEAKTSMIEKIKEHKLQILQCTKTLFQKILKEEDYEKEHIEAKENKIEAILQSLHSFPSLEQISQSHLQKEPNIDHLKLLNIQIQNGQFKEKEKKLDFSSPLQIVQAPSNQILLQQFDLNEKVQQNEKSTQNLEIQQYRIVKIPQTKHLLPQQDLKKIKASEDSRKIKKLIKFDPQNKPIQDEQNSAQQEETKNQKDQFFTQKLSLKLDLRLDEVVLGSDEYPQNQVEQKSQIKRKSQLELDNDTEKDELSKREDQTSFQPQHQQKIQQQTKQTMNQFTMVEMESKKESNVDIEVQFDEDIKQSQQTKQLQVDLKNVQQIQFLSRNQTQAIEYNDEKSDDRKSADSSQDVSHKPNINIPLILTQDKMQSLQMQKNRVFKENLQKHIGFQLGCLQIQTQEGIPKHFTTLVDINSFIVGFYEFMMRKYLNTLVDNLNIPYGKSVIDKIYSLQTTGEVMEEKYNQMNNIMSENNFLEYQREFTLTVRKCSEYETIHNKAVFNAFNKCINEYRPYYQLQGQVYPWLVSQKGITFYQINQQNIEQVFEKSKIKVLQMCSLLCGLHPPSEVKNIDQKEVVQNKRKDTQEKMLKNEILQSYAQWQVRYVNYECLVRLLVAETIYQTQINQLVKDIDFINQTDYQHKQGVNF